MPSSDVEDVDEGLGGQQTELLEVLHLQLVALDRGEDGVAAFQHRLGGLDGGQLGGFPLLDLDFFFDPRDGIFDGLQVGQDQLGVDGLHVRAGIDLAVDVDDVGVIEHAHDLGDGLGLADVGEELVAQAFALGRALHDAGDVHEGHRGGQQALGAEDRRRALRAAGPAGSRRRHWARSWRTGSSLRAPGSGSVR